MHAAILQLKQLACYRAQCAATCNFVSKRSSYISHRVAAAMPPKGNNQKGGGGGKNARGQKNNTRSQIDDDAKMHHYTCSLQVLCTDVEHNSPSLLLFLDKEGRYMFNAGEGMQRLVRENKLKMQKLENYFFTRVSAEVMAGLPGLLLSYPPSSSDAGGLLKGQDTANIYGPVGTSAYIHALEPYVNQEQQLHVVDIPAAGGAGSQPVEPVLKTRFMSITPVPLSLPPHSQAKRRIEDEQVDSSSAGGEGRDQPASKRAREAETPGQQGTTCPAGPATPPPSAMEQDGTGAAGGEPSSADRPVTLPPPAAPGAVCYAIEMIGSPGKFDPKKAAELGVPKGPAYGELQRGKPVMVEGGREIQPHEVMDPPCVPGPLVLVVDCPSEQLMEVLLQQDGPLSKWTAQGSDGADPSSPLHKLRVMAHFTPPALAATPRYQAWISGLSGWRHVMVHAGHGLGTTLRRATVLQAKLNCLHPGLFPLLHKPSQGPSDAPAPPHASPAALPPVPSTPAGPEAATGKGEEASSSSSSGAEPLLLCPNGYRFHLLPIRIRGPDTTDVGQEPNIPEVQQQFRSAAEDIIAGASLAAQQSSSTAEPVPQLLQQIGRDEVEVTFLGTASSQPSKYRNVTAIYVDRFHRGGMLMDCGEDTLGQLKRRYGARETEARVLGLACIWVSHMHADHHGGLYRLLEWRAQLAEAAGQVASPLLIIGPMTLFRVIGRYREVLHLPCHFLANGYFNPHRATQHNPPLVVLQMYEQVKQRLGLRALLPFEVAHVRDAYGLCIEGEADWKLVFSGDTRPTQKLVDAGRGATLLIHEATFEDVMAAEAAAKKHSTTSDAMRMAKECGAYRSILTHFSTRYPTMPAFDMAARPDVAVAMDFMSVNLADLPWLPGIVQPLDQLFQKEQAGWEADEAGAAGEGAATAGAAAATAGTMPAGATPQAE